MVKDKIIDLLGLDKGREIVDHRRKLSAQAAWERILAEQQTIKEYFVKFSDDNDKFKERMSIMEYNYKLHKKDIRRIDRLIRYIINVFRGRIVPAILNKKSIFTDKESDND